jgi:Co/Zn/Cd efflux system component
VKDCCEVEPQKEAFGKVLWVALGLNFLMFVVEVAAGYSASSVSLQADALDFLGDSANYAISIFVLHKSLQLRTRASLIKAFSMGTFGLWVLGSAVYNLVTDASPVAATMGMLGVIALVVNISVAVLLFKFRADDSNAQSVWLCTRNDAIGNVAVILAAGGVYFTGTAWPDLLVAVLLSSLGVHSAVKVVQKVKAERLSAVHG